MQFSSDSVVSQLLSEESLFELTTSFVHSDHLSSKYLRDKLGMTVPTTVQIEPVSKVTSQLNDHVDKHHTLNEDTPDVMHDVL